MTTDNKRDLAADLAICEAATAGPWEVAPDVCGPEGMAVYETEDYGCICEVGDPYARGNNRPAENMRMIAEAREGWPEAIRRAMAAEKAAQEFAEIINDKQAEVIRLRKDKLRLHDVYDAQYARATEYWGEVELLREQLMHLYQKAKNDVARWDGGQCVGTTVFQDRAFTRRLVRDLTPILFPEGADASDSQENNGR